MLQQFTSVKEEERYFTEEEIGGYNDPPPHLRMISEKEFVQSKFFSHCPLYRETRQIHNPEKLSPVMLSMLQQTFKGHIEMTLYWYGDGSGVGLARNYWGGKMYYFDFFICEHEFESIERRMCYSRSKCKKCGYIHEVDSTD